MARQSFGKLCLTIDPLCLFKVPGRSTSSISAGQTSFSGKDWLQQLEAAKSVRLRYYKNHVLRKDRKEDHSTIKIPSTTLRCFYNIHKPFIMKTPTDIERAEFDPSKYELWEDVPDFLKMITSDKWPWSETIIRILLRDIHDQKEIGNSLDAAVLNHLGFQRRKGAKYTYLGQDFVTLYGCSSTNLPFRAIHRSLQSSRPDHEGFTELLLSRSITSHIGVSGAARENFPVAHLVRPGDLYWPGDGDIDTDPSKIHFMDRKFERSYYNNLTTKRVAGYPIGIRALPTMTSLMALDCWRPGMRDTMELVARL